MTETELLELIRELAIGQLGLLVFHRQDSRRDVDWSRGLPDLVIASPAGHGVLFAELKSAGGTLSREQRRWWRALQACGATYVLWRPADWASGEIRQRLMMLAQP